MVEDDAQTNDVLRRGPSPTDAVQCDFGVSYRDWQETWQWTSVAEERLVRFDRLLPAIKFARERSRDRCRVTGDQLTSAQRTAERDVSFRTPPRVRDSAFDSRGTTSQFQRPPTINTQAVRVFSEERLSQNQSRAVWSFFTADYGTLWGQLSRRKFRDVHCYEIIEEDHPCHLYFDLEFQKEFNKALNGNTMVHALLTELERVLQRRWEISLKSAFIMEMDASTETKFSRHLIIRLNGFAFRNNAQLKPVVKELLYNLAPLRSFDVNTENGEANFVDEAVYSKNRSFRMLWCSKSGKKNPLKPCKRFSLMDYSSAGRRHTQRLFSLSLICNVNADVHLLEAQDDIGRTPCGATSTASKMIRTQGRQFELLHCSKDDHGPCFFEQRAVHFIPLVEHLILHLAGNSAKVQKVVLIGYDGLVSYNVTGPGAHYCHLAGRSHKSNHVYYLIDLQFRSYKQRCYDLLCDNTRAKWTPIPQHLLEHHHLYDTSLLSLSTQRLTLQ